MWEFFNNVLNQAGFVATIFVAVVAFGGGAVYALWRQNQRLHDRAEETAQAHLSKLLELSKEHAEQLVSMAVRVDELQERRIKEAGALTERVMDHIKHIDQFAAKLEATIDVVLQSNRYRDR